MHPVLIKLGPVTIYVYGLMMATAFMLAYYILQWELKRRKEDPEFAGDLIFWGAIGGIVGAKLFFAVENFSDVLLDPKGTIFSGSGLVFHGGLIGGTIVVVSLILIKKKSLGSYGDMIAPVLLLGQGIGRIGCLFAGCCHGGITNCPINIHYPGGSQASYLHYHEGLLDSGLMESLGVHPTPIYETIFNTIMFVILIKFIRPKMKKRGSTFAIFLIIAGAERFMLEFLRVNPKGLFGLTHYQFSSIFFVALGTVLLLFFVKQDKDSIEIGL